MLPAAVVAMTAVLRHGRQRVVAARLGPRGAPAGRGVPRDASPRRSARGPSEVLFTSGGTESDNLAVKGIFWARRTADPRRTPDRSRRRRAPRGARRGASGSSSTRAREVTLAAGRRAAAGSHPRRCAPSSPRTPTRPRWSRVMWANNEVGTVKPIRELAAVAREYDVPMHTDAVQAVGTAAGRLRGQRPVRADRHRAQVRRPARARVRCCSAARCRCVPLLHGGGQERDVRSGTLDTAGDRGDGGGAADDGAPTDRAARRSWPGCATT